MLVTNRLALALLLFGIPESALAALAVSEVAWMGDSVSANHEWIELYNGSGETVSIDGWTITDSNTLSIPLSGTVPAGSYVVLERTSDESASGNAFLVYTGALVNTGTTLTLRDQSGSIIDQVVGGENWESIGGSNDSKDTAQYSGTKWVTAPGTPGRANATESSEQTTTGNTTTSSGRSGSTNLLKVEKKTVKLELADTTLSLTIDAPELVYVGQTVDFEVVPSGPTKVVLDSMKYQWNFGDLATGGGSKTSHRYRYPGEYVLTVHGAYGRHEQVARATVTVLPVSLSLTTDGEGNVQVNNDAPYEVFLSNYTLAGAVERTFPLNTVLLPRATITVPKQVQSSLPVYLKDATGKVVAASGQREQIAPQVLVAPEPFTYPLAIDEAPLLLVEPQTATAFQFATTSVPTVSSTSVPIEVTTSDIRIAPTKQVAVATSDVKEPSNQAFFGLIALLVVAISALYLVRPPTR